MPALPRFEVWSPEPSFSGSPHPSPPIRWLLPVHAPSQSAPSLWASLFLPVPGHLSFSTQDASLRSVPWGLPGVSGASSTCLYLTIHHRITKRFLWVYSDLSNGELRAGQPVFSMFVHCAPRGRLTIKLVKLRLRALGSWGLFQGPGRARGTITLLALSSL